jgi:hypothetical protein
MGVFGRLEDADEEVVDPEREDDEDDPDEEGVQCLDDRQSHAGVAEISPQQDRGRRFVRVTGTDREHHQCTDQRHQNGHDEDEPQFEERGLEVFDQPQLQVRPSVMVSVGTASGAIFVTFDTVPRSMEGESNWVVNGIIMLALVVLLIPLANGFVEDLDSLLLVILIMYAVYTALSGEAIDPHQPK